MKFYKINEFGTDTIMYDSEKNIHIFDVVDEFRITLKKQDILICLSDDYIEWRDKQDIYMQYIIISFIIF